MASIYSYVTGSETEVCLLLGNSSPARKCNILASNDWNKIRMTWRGWLDDSGASLGGTPQFQFGICSGSDYRYDSPNCKHFLGIGSNGTTWTRSVSGSAVYSSSASGMFGVKKVGTTITRTVSINSSAAYYISWGADYRCAMSVDITRGNPNYTIGGIKRASAPVVDTDLTTMFLMAELPAFTVSGYSFVTERTIACDESVDGYFDHVTFSWDRDTYKFHICDILVTRLS